MRLKAHLLLRGAAWALPLAAFASTTALANELRVPSQYPTIQAAVTAASPGDTVLIAKGVYKGSGNVNIDCLGKPITVQGAGYLSTIIDCQGLSRGFIFHNNETSSTQIRSLTVRRGSATQGAAILMVDSNPAIIRCSFEDCIAQVGGAVSLTSSNPGLISCRFERDKADLGGGGIYSDASSPTISGCTFENNETRSAGGAVDMRGGSLMLVSCIFNDNVADSGGAAFSSNGGNVAFVNGSFATNTADTNGGAVDLTNGTVAAFTNCTFAANLSKNGPGGIRIADGCNATISNSILWTDGKAEVSGPANIRYSCVSGGAPGPGNTEDSPKLVDAIGHDLHINVGSSCIDKGDQTSIVIDQDQDGRSRVIGTGPDMGAYEYPITRPTAIVSANANVFTVPHDGNPLTDTANVTVTGSGYDWLLGNLSYQWMVEDAVVGTTPTITLQLEPGDREFDLQVRDASGGIAADKIIVKVLPEPNNPPVASAGPDQTVVSTGGTVQVVLHGHGYDADGDPLTYQWSNGETTSDDTLNLAPGNYSYTLTVTDPYGATSTSTANVHVIDGTPPIVTLNGDANMTQEVFVPWSDPGASAEDGVDGKDLAISTSGFVNVNKLGTYTLTYTARDNSGNVGSTTRSVKVADTIPPVITLKGSNPIQLECSQGYVEPGASAIDNYDGTVNVTISGSVPSTKGTYVVTYTATDSSGNIATVNRTVNVTDTAAPIITLKGSSPMTVQCGSGYNEPGATATDACDGVLPVTITGTVPSAVGTYIVTYKATDSSGNSASVNRVVNVVDTLPPVITLNGSNPMTVDCVKGYTEPGATAKDACDGSIAVVITGSVPSTVGTYTITYTATDSHGNKATATRTVTVVSKTPPSANAFNATPTNIKADGKIHAVNLHYGFNSHCASFTWDVECTANQTLAAGDVQKIDNNNFNVKGVSGRVYTFTLRATDINGNTASWTTTVVCN